ncbi:MAG: cell wall metabolism sensor histidine kinase WalK [Lachnospiraceae bacterium]|nr:cell wall metabolism sensor histidine kinase WalK [Lachnospiraceae bacterium]
MKKKTHLYYFFKSLRTHFMILVLAVIIIPSVIISTVIIKNYEAHAVSVRESEISAQALLIANQIGSSENFKKDKIDSDLASQITILSTMYDGRLMVVNDVYNIVYDSYNLDNNKTIIANEVMRSFNGETVIAYDGANSYIEMTIPIMDPEASSQKVIGVLLLSVSTDSIGLNKEYITNVAIITVAIVGVAFSFFGILASWLLVRPINKISTAIEHVQDGYHGDDKLMVNNFTETINICEKFNDLLARMKLMNDSREEFVANVSHELKTPLTSVKVLADSINSMPDAPLEMYQEFMGDITNEIDRETKIINDLLSLVRMDKSSSDLNLQNVNVNELVEQILKRLQPIADKQKVSLVLESFRPIMADVDEVKITLAITNLIENAIKYNKNDGEGYVHISLNADHQYFYLKVEDSGMGIPEESLDHIYERFYRVDKSHSREIGGTGLGLAITRNAILMHRGSIKVYSVLGEGTTFDVRIPLKYIV